MKQQLKLIVSELETCGGLRYPIMTPTPTESESESEPAINKFSESESESDLLKNFFGVGAEIIVTSEKVLLLQKPQSFLFLLYEQQTLNNF